MNPRIKKLWVDALRSGNYKQGKGQLRDDRNNFCCLGVLCNLHAMEHPKIVQKEYDKNRYLGKSEHLPEMVRMWAGIKGNYAMVGSFIKIRGIQETLASHNDNGCTFLEIADAIEEQL